MPCHEKGSGEEGSHYLQLPQGWMLPSSIHFLRTFLCVLSLGDQDKWVEEVVTQQLLTHWYSWCPPLGNVSVQRGSVGGWAESTDGKERSCFPY
jgi:hypothetical protein